jgi:hypothetical protein
VRFIIASYTYELRQETHIIDVIKLPHYDPKNELHQKISELSRRAHDIAKCIYASVKPDYCRDLRDPEGELRRVEEELDKAVAQLYGIPEDVVEDFKKLMKVLEGVEVPEEAAEEEEITPSIDFTKTYVFADQRDFIEFSVSTAEYCDRAEVVFEAPWGVQRISVGDGRHRVEVRGLKEGIYDVRFRLVCGDYVKDGVVKVSVSKFVSKTLKRPSTLADLFDKG